MNAGNQNHGEKFSPEMLEALALGKALQEAHDQETERAGDGTRTHDILLGKKPISRIVLDTVLDYAVYALLPLFVVWVLLGNGFDLWNAIFIAVCIEALCIIGLQIANKLGV